MIKRIKQLFLAGILFSALALGSVYVANKTVIKSAEGYIYTNVHDIPYNKVGLVLGTAKTLRNGNDNLYFTYRINATVQLFESGKIAYVLVSGDNSRSDYDEPTDFKNELIKRGIPPHRIVLDYAGFRTLDSVVRAQKVFGQNALTFISQHFHNERAIYLSQKHGLTAVAYDAQNVSGRYGIRVQLREYLARTKAIIDVVVGKEPKFLGPKITIG